MTVLYPSFLGCMNWCSGFGSTFISPNHARPACLEFSFSRGFRYGCILLELRGASSRDEEERARIGAKEKFHGIVQRNKPASPIPSTLSDAENDLISRMEQGWQLETDSLGGNPVFRNMSSDEVIRPLSANRNTVKALEKRGLIVQGKGGDPLRRVLRQGTT